MREALLADIIRVRQLPDGRWEARVEEIGVVATGPSRAAAEDAVVALVIPKLESLPQPDQIRFLESRKKVVLDDSCKITSVDGEPTTGPNLRAVDD